MPVPVQIQLFDAFLGTQEGIHSIILPDIFSSGGAMNLFIDKYGRAKKVSGYTKINSSPVTTNTGGSTGKFRGIFPYKKNNTDGSVSRWLVGVLDDGTDEWEIWTSADSGVNWTFQQDLGATPVGRVPGFAQFGNTLYITNTVTTPRTWNGTAVATAGSTQSPQPTATDSGNAGYLTGHYVWKLVTINADGSRKYGSASSSTLFLSSKKASLSWTQDADATSKGYEVYRTTGNGDVFYYVDYVDGRATVAYTDNVSDLTILQNRVLEENGDAPPSAYFAIPHKQRIWWLRTDALPTRGWFSDPALPDSVYQATNYIDFSDSETVGDVITGGLGNYEGQLIVSTERALWTISGTGQVIGNIFDWTRTKTNAQVGSVSGRSFARIPAGSKYSNQEGKMQITPVVTIAYFTPLGDIRLFDGDNDIIISQPVKTTLSSWNYAHRAKVFALHDATRNEVAWVFPSTNSSTEPDLAVVWNYRWGVWYKRSWGFAHAVDADTSTASSLLIGSSTSAGTVYQLWNGNSNDGTAINSLWMTKTLYGVNQQAQPAMSNQKRWRWVDLLFETEQTVVLTVEWLPGNTPDNGASFGSTTVLPSAADILTASGDFIQDAGATGTLILSAASTLAKAQLKNTSGRYLHDTGIRLRIGDNASAGSWSLEAMNLAYQILPGMLRRFQ